MRMVGRLAVAALLGLCLVCPNSGVLGWSQDEPSLAPAALADTDAGMTPVYLLEADFSMKETPAVTKDFAGAGADAGPMLLEADPVGEAHGTPPQTVLPPLNPPSLETMPAILSAPTPSPQTLEPRMEPDSPTMRLTEAEEPNPDEAVPAPTAPMNPEPVGVMAPAPINKHIAANLKGRLLGHDKIAPGTTFSPLPAMLVLPVLRHGNEKAFGDVAIVFANELASKLEEKYPQTTIHNPVYSVEALRLRGLGETYNKMMDFYVKAGQPEPRALQYLLSELEGTSNQSIGRVVFVEADVDMMHLNRSVRPKDVFRKLYNDSLPAEQRYYVKSRVKVYDTSHPHHKLVWAFNWTHPVKATGIYNVTPSVYQDSDSLARFGDVSRLMSTIVLKTSPQYAYEAGSTEITTAVQGNLNGVTTQPLTSKTVIPNEQTTPVTPEDKQALERILNNGTGGQ